MIYKKLKDVWLHGILYCLIFFALLYIFSCDFRYYLSDISIDPNFLVAFVAIVTLIVSIIENKKERKYNFKSDLQKSVEEKAAAVIGKLFVIMNDSENCLKTIKDIKYSINQNKKFIDINNVLSLDYIKKDREIVGAYITIYFAIYIQSDWNSMNEKVNSILTNCSLVLNNYNHYYNLIGSKDFQNDVLNNIDEYIGKSEVLYKEIYDLTENMKNILLKIVVDNQNNLKKYIN